MLLSLSVKNLALIENAEVNFGKGLNVFTGETGAGKSLVIGSVNLALGGRARGNILRDDDSPVEIELVFSLEDPDKLSLLREMDVPVEEDGLIIIRRRISPGRNVAKVNGRTVTGAELREIGAILIDIHAQSEHQSLLYEKNHILFLDKYAGAGAEEALKEYGDKYASWKSLEAELNDLETDASARDKEAELLKYEINEIEEAKLKKDEDTELEDRFRLMNNSQKIAQGTDEAYNLLFGENEGAAASVIRAMRSMGGSAEYDGEAGKIYEEIANIDSLLSDLRRDLGGYIASLEYSPEEFTRVTDRLDLINTLKMKYGRSVDEIVEALKSKQERLSALENYDEHLKDLKERYDSAYREMEKAAEKLTSIRKEAALCLGKDMVTSLADLNFLESEFKVAVERADSFSASGRDRVFFMISTNPGEEMKPLKEVASGGELSRIMLALKTVLADMDDIGTMIFDEIDTGISGRTAQKVSESLIKLSGSHQVILITHLPQIAAMADSHFLIEKQVEGGRTKTEILDLDREEMVKELGRMLSGASLTDRVMENAREMKDLADNKKQGRSGA